MCQQVGKSVPADDLGVAKLFLLPAGVPVFSLSEQSLPLLAVRVLFQKVFLKHFSCEKLCCATCATLNFSMDSSLISVLYPQLGSAGGKYLISKTKNDLIKNTGAETVLLSYYSLCVLHLGREDKVLVQVVHVLHHPALGGPAKADEVERLEVLDHLAEANAACMHGAG